MTRRTGNNSQADRRGRAVAPRSSFDVNNFHLPDMVRSCRAEAGSKDRVFVCNHRRCRCGKSLTSHAGLPARARVCRGMRPRAGCCAGTATRWSGCRAGLPRAGALRRHHEPGRHQGAPAGPPAARFDHCCFCLTVCGCRMCVGADRLIWLKLRASHARLALSPVARQRRPFRSGHYESSPRQKQASLVSRARAVPGLSGGEGTLGQP